MPVSNERTPIAPARSNHIARREHLFFSWMAVAAALAVFGGFARTWFLKPWTGTPSLPLIVHIHAAVFTAWMLLFIIQTAFVARHRLGAHRRLGIAGGALAVVMVVLGCVIAISGARRGFMGQFPDEPAGFADALSFLTLGLGDMLLFAVFVSAALYYRRNRQAHKRLMLLATISLLPAALTRFPAGAARVPIAAAALLCFVAAGPLYDWKTRGRVHAAFLWGGLLIVITTPLRPVIGNSAAWHGIARFLVR